MNDVALEKQIREIAQELKASGETADKRLIQLRADIDRCRLEIDALKRFLESAFPAFGDRYEALLEETRREVNPDVQ